MNEKLVFRRWLCHHWGQNLRYEQLLCSLSEFFQRLHRLPFSSSRHFQSNKRCRSANRSPKIIHWRRERIRRVFRIIKYDHWRCGPFLQQWTQRSDVLERWNLYSSHQAAVYVLNQNLVLLPFQWLGIDEVFTLNQLMK